MLYSIASGIAILLTFIGISSAWREKHIECSQNNQTYHGTTYADVLVALLIGWNLLAYITQRVTQKIAENKAAAEAEYSIYALLTILTLGTGFIVHSIIRNIKVRLKYKSVLATHPNP